eukprot:TRINITY_DN1498_c0_g1_i1.p1 TRINITY_DN1498_c0_g1~~TRINITY_DN1498_c0_g1_i1.p1  ORF type:complete len:220 (+),score=42.33 TRINITY_DN1498_c0_g1_i1:1-660(+)
MAWARLKRIWIRIMTDKLNFPSAERNTEPILEILKTFVKEPATKCLEIASGSGQHGLAFTNALPALTWQPSDCNFDYFKSISAYAAESATKAIQPPLCLDMTDKATISKAELANSYDLVYNANMIHISPPSTLNGLALTCQQALKAHGHLLLYGPFAFDGSLEPESNRNFDASLKSRNSTWGIRDTIDIKRVMLEHGLKFEEAIAMPANNHILVFVKRT